MIVVRCARFAVMQGARWSLAREVATREEQNEGHTLFHRRFEQAHIVKLLHVQPDRDAWELQLQRPDERVRLVLTCSKWSAWH